MRLLQPENINTATQQHHSVLQKDGGKNFFGQKSKPVLSAPSIQPKLAINQPNDEYEQEADTVADNVVQRLSQPVPAGNSNTVTDNTSTNISLLQKKCDSCEQEEQPEETETVQHKLMRKPAFESTPPPADDDGNNIQLKCAACNESPFAKASGDKEEKVQRKVGGTPQNTVSAGIESKLASSKGNGVPLTAPLQKSMGSAIGADFSGVKIHTDSSSIQMSKDLNAQAFTHGNDIYFNENKFNPDSKDGQHLLAHELTHTVQQGAAAGIQKSVLPTPVIQRDPGNEPKASGPKATDRGKFKNGDTEVQYWLDLGMASISLYGEPWVQLRWQPGSGKDMFDIMTSMSDSPRQISIGVNAKFDIEVTINTNIEQRYADLFFGGTTFAHRYTAKGKKVTVNKHLTTSVGPGVAPAANESAAKNTDSVTSITKYSGHETLKPWNPEFNPEMPNVGDPGPMANPAYDTNFFWLFDNKKQAQAFALAFPHLVWVTDDRYTSKIVAVALDEKGAQALAEKTRELPEPDFTGLYVEGKEWDPWLLYDHFYTTDWSARYGYSGESEECLVYRHGKNSFGRKSLEHADALTEWWFLDLTSVADAEQKLVNDHPFEKLFVQGDKGSIYEIGLKYLRARDRLFIAVTNKKSGDKSSLNPWASSFGWGDVITDDIWYSYLQPATDRPEGSLPDDLKELMWQNPQIIEEGGNRVLKEVEHDCKWQAIFALEGAIKGLNIYAGQDNARRLFQKMIFMSEKEQQDALTFIGIEPWLQPLWLFVLKDKAWATRIWMGEENTLISPERIAEKIKEQLKGLQEFKAALQNEDENPLYMEGDFGYRIREQVYKSHGFKLHPANFPHHTEAAARTGNKTYTGAFGSEAGYMFAQAASAEASRRKRNKWLKIFALVIATVVLVLVAGAIGAAVAGLLFSTATVAGAVGFVVVELAVSAAIVTLAGPGMQTFILSGGTATAADYEKAYSNLGKQYVINLATFGFFKALGAATRAVAVAGAGSKQAFNASRAWKAADVGLRVTTSGGAFFGIGVLSQYLQTGKTPNSEEMGELLFETALSVVLLEVGAFAARGPMKQLQNWSRNQRLGDFAPQMDKLLVEATIVNAEVAEFAVRPHEAGTKGMEILGKQKDIIKRQKILVDSMSKSFRTRPDAKALEFEMNRINEQFDLLINQLRDVEFFAKAKIKPGGRMSEESALFTYERGQEKEIIDYYGKENVKEIEGGGLLVTQEGRTLTFKPANPLDPTLLPDGSRSPDVLNTWRSTLAAKRLAVLEKAFNMAESNAELEKIQKSDPATMKEKDLLKFEKSLIQAEAALTKTGAKKSAVDLSQIDQVPGESTESWRLRLLEIRNNLVQRAALLGYKDVAAFIKKLPTARPNLTKETLAKHAEAMKKSREQIDQFWGERYKQDKTVQALTPEKEVTELKDRLRARQEELKTRARAYNASDSQYIKDAVKGIGGASKLSTLRDIEVMIEKAEARLDKAAAAALDKAVEKYGKPFIDEARTGELAGLSDQQVGDVMRMLKNAGSLSPAALRGAMFAAMPPPGKSTAASPVPLEKAVDYARSTGELNFVLESYLALSEAGIEGSYQLMRDATTSPGKWKGAVWQMELIRIVIGTKRVKGVEVKAAGREIDIWLTDGTRVEAKDWNTWDAEKLDKQFTRDLDAETNGGKNADGIKKIQWAFRDPIPVTEAKILTTMKTSLENFIAGKLADGSITTAQADALRKAFNEHTGLLSIPKIDAKHVAPPKPIITGPALPPPAKKDDEK